MMLEVLRQDYIRTAWAKGLKEQMRHAIKNALPGRHPGRLAIMENLFNLPGLGRPHAHSEHPVVSGVNLFFA